MKNLSFLFAAYAAIWILLFLYITNLVRRSRSLQREIDELRQLLQRRESRPTPAANDESQ